jgi:hypothetical protein
MRVTTDKSGQPMVEWEQANGHHKRAWIQRKSDPTLDWANAPGRRYLNVVRVDISTGNPAGNPTDFPVFCDLPDDQVLIAFVAAVCGTTGCPLP